jgi:hypothetical protein
MNEETSPQKAHKAQKKPTILPFVLFVVKFLHMWPGHSNAKRCKYFAPWQGRETGAQKQAKLGPASLPGRENSERHIPVVTLRSTTG